MLPKHVYAVSRISCKKKKKKKVLCIIYALPIQMGRLINSTQKPEQFEDHNFSLCNDNHNWGHLYYHTGFIFGHHFDRVSTVIFDLSKNDEEVHISLLTMRIFFHGLLGPSSPSLMFSSLSTKQPKLTNHNSFHMPSLLLQSWHVVTPLLRQTIATVWIEGIHKSLKLCPDTWIKVL